MKERHGLFESIAYWVQWSLLQVFGPGQRDTEHDPIDQLKIKYRRPTHRW